MEEAQSISTVLYEWGSEGVRKWAECWETGRTKPCEFMLEWILSTEVCIWREGCLGGEWRKVSDLRVPLCEAREGRVQDN